MITQTLFSPETVSLFTKLVVAMLCGALIGTERIIAHKTAGMRTYALVAMGSALFIALGQIVFANLHLAGVTGIDPFHIPAAIITGVGFMGAGIFILKDTGVTGLTTASGLWVSAGIGIACGYGLFTPALMTTVLMLFVFVVLWYVEQGVRKISSRNDTSKS